MSAQHDADVQRHEALSERVDALGRIGDERDRRYSELRAADQKAIETALLAQEKAVTAALSAADRAVSKAETAAEKRFEGLNEFRESLADQAANLMPRAETEIRLGALSQELARITEAVSQSGGRQQGVSATIATIIAIVAIMMVPVAAFITYAVSHK